MTRVQIGSISTGTLSDLDLLDSFADELERLDDQSTLVKQARALMYEFSQASAHSPQLETEATELVNEFMDAFSEHAPPHVYFGTLEGDGADFGFWPTGEPFELCDLVDTPTGWFDNDCLVYVEINDHGNVTVLDINHKEIWSAV